MFLALLLAIGLVGLGIGGSANGGIFDALGLTDAAPAAAPSSTRRSTRRTRSSTPTPTTAGAADGRPLLLPQGPGVARHRRSGQRLDHRGHDQRLGGRDQRLGAYLDTLGPRRSSTTPSRGRSCRLTPASPRPRPTHRSSLASSPPPLTRRSSSPGSPERTWLQAAAFAYYSGDVKKGEEAGKKALAEANQADRYAVTAQLKQFEKQGEAIAKQLKQTGPTKEDLENPLAPLGGSSGSSGAIPTTPTP